MLVARRLPLSLSLSPSPSLSLSDSLSDSLSVSLSLSDSVSHSVSLTHAVSRRPGAHHHHHHHQQHLCGGDPRNPEQLRLRAMDCGDGRSGAAEMVGNSNTVRGGLAALVRGLGSF